MAGRDRGGEVGGWGVTEEKGTLKRTGSISQCQSKPQQTLTSLLNALIYSLRRDGLGNTSGGGVDDLTLI